MVRTLFWNKIRLRILLFLGQSIIISVSISRDFCDQQGYDWLGYHSTSGGSFMVTLAKSVLIMLEINLKLCQYKLRMKIYYMNVVNFRFKLVKTQCLSKSNKVET